VYPHEDLRFDPNVPTKRAINYDTPLGAITVLRDSVSTREILRDMVSSDDFLGIMSPDEMLLSTLLETRTKYIIGDITCRRGKIREGDQAPREGYEGVDNRHRISYAV
jgi:hypothetical protein